jgi:hypothetical protein
VAEEQIEISIVLDDGSVRQGFARIQRQGDDTAEALSTSFARATKAFLGLGAAFLGLRGIGSVFSGAIDGAIESDQAVTRLSNSLALAGRFSDTAANSFDVFADRIQRTTVIQDEQVLSLVSLATNYAKTNEQAEKLVQSAIDLSAANPTIGLEEAVIGLGKSLSGTAGRLAATVPILKQLTAEQLKNGAAITVVGERYRNAAENEVNSLSGSLTRLRNLFGEFTERLGKSITQSDAFKRAIESLTGVVIRAIELVPALVSSLERFGSIVGSIARVLLDVGLAIVVIQGSIFALNTVIAVSTALWTTLRTVVLSFQLATELGASGIFKLTGAFGFLTTSINLTTLAINGLKVAATFGLALAIDQIISKFVEFSAKTRTIGDTFTLIGLTIERGFFISLRNIVEYIAINFPQIFKIFGVDGPALFEKLSKKLEELNGEITKTTDDAATKVKTAFQPTNNPTVIDEVKAKLPELSTLFGLARNEIDFFNDKLGNLDTGAFNAKVEEIKKSFKQLGVEGRNALGQGIGAGFAQFGQALVKGENAVEAFAKAFIGAIGQQAIASGTRFILEGLAYLVVPGFQATGGAMIAAGSALAAFGGILSAVGSPASPTAGGATGTSGQLQQQPSLVADEDALLNQAEQQRVTVNIQGDVLDSRESGLRIVELIQDAFDTQGAQVRVT